MAKKVDFVVSGYIFENEKVLLIFHKKLKKWLPPGGHIEDGETPEEALKREIYEETGLKVSIINQISFSYSKESSPFLLNKPEFIQWEKIEEDHHHINLIYLCQIEDKKDIKDGVDFFNLEELENMKDIPENVIYQANYFYKKYYLVRQENKLPVMSYFVDKGILLKAQETKLFIIQHLKKNTIYFIQLLRKAGFKDIFVIGKNYSLEHPVKKEIEKIAKVFTSSFEELESLKTVEQVVNENLNEKDKFICLDLGGYFSKFFQYKNDKPYRIKNLLGIIEDTKNGLWFEKQDIKNFKFPLLSVASSFLKDYGEGYFVAKAISRNLENILIESQMNQTAAFKKILILGYGKIGKRVGEFLQKENEVYIYDINPLKLFEAKIDGFYICEKLQNLDKFDVIIGVTGDVVLNKKDLLALRNGTILVNGSTRKKEFDLDSLKEEIEKIVDLGSYQKIFLKNGKRIYLLNNGYPVNFYKTESVPDMIIDLVFSEIYLLTSILLSKKISPGYYPIEKFFPEIEEKVAKTWIKFWTE